MAENLDDDRLLPGETTAVASGRRDDAQHWADVYTELYSFKADLMRELSEQRGRVEPDGQSEIQNDEKMFTREAERLKRRLDFWQAELSKRLS